MTFKKNTPLAGWQGTWIQSPLTGGPRTTAPVPYFRKTFGLDSEIQRAVLHVTALGLYEFAINGQQIGHDVLAPGWMEYTKRVYYQSHDVTSCLAKGENVIGAILGDGWYCGHIGNHNRQHYGDRPRLLAQLEIELDDGQTLVVATDTTWKTSPGPILEADLLMGEAYDARRELGAWSAPRFDDRSWTPALEFDAPSITIERSPGPPVRRQEILDAEVIATGRRMRRYNFGQNLVGRLRIRVQAPEGTHLIMTHAERLREDGTLYTENYRSARCTNHYTCKGDGVEEWEPRFTFQGFQYAEINGLPEDATLEVEAVVLHSDMKRTGEFSCSHPLLNKLYQNIVWGQKGNFVDIPTDCPQRDERLGWTGDAQVFARTAAFNFDVQTFFHKWLQAMRDGQGSLGQIPAVVPDPGVPMGIERDSGPAWADAATICPWTIYLCYGDKQILADHYDCMARWFEFMDKHRAVDGIRSPRDKDRWGGFGDWLALEHHEPAGGRPGTTPRELIGTAMYAHSADIMARTAAILGKDGDARNYRELHDRIVKAFRRRFVTPDGMVFGNTQTAWVLALHFDLLPEDVRATAAKELVHNIRSRGITIGTGFVGTPYILDILERFGHLDVAYELLEQENYPSWLFPVTQGATTIWERWDGWTPDKGFQTAEMNSFNHYAYGAVGAWMVRTVAGLDLDPENPGYRHIVFRPRPGGSIRQARARLESVAGPVAVEWELADNRTLTVRMSVPQDAAATFSPPPGYTATTESLTPGSHERVLAVRE